jgi:hypothetical protein
MSAIQDKIKQLQRQAAKIELLRQIQNAAQTLNEPVDHPGITNEVNTLLNTFIDAAVSKIESGDSFGTTDRSGTVNLTSEELSLIRRLLPALTGAQPVHEAVSTAGTPPPLPPRPRTLVQSDLSREDRAAFALQYRELGGKKVKAVTDSGLPVEGPVLKLDAPFLMVRNDLQEGELTAVRPENLQ